MPSYQPNKWHAKGMSLQIFECIMFLLRKAGYQARFLSLVKTKQRCAGPEALKIDLYSWVYTSRCLFSVAAKDGPLPLATFPPSCHHKRGFWPTSGTAQHLSLNYPSLTRIWKTSLIALCFFFTRSYAALRAADLDWIIGPGYSSGGNKQKRDWGGVTTDLLDV